MFCWHKWSKWTEIKVEVTPRIDMEIYYLSMLDKSIKQPEPRVEDWQKRYCVKCGKTQRIPQ